MFDLYGWWPMKNKMVVCSGLHCCSYGVSCDLKFRIVLRNLTGSACNNSECESIGMGMRLSVYCALQYVRENEWECVIVFCLNQSS